MKPKMTQRERAAVARLRSVLRLTVRQATALLAKLNTAGERLPEYEAFSGATSVRAEKLLRTRSALSAAIVAAEDAIKAAQSTGAPTPRRNNPARPKAAPGRRRPDPRTIEVTAGVESLIVSCGGTSKLKKRAKKAARRR